MTWLRLTLGAALLSAMAGVWYSGVWQDLSLPQLAEQVRDMGGYGPLLFIALFCVAELIQIPSVLFVIAAGLIWPTPLALLLAWGGSVAAAMTVFSIARWLSGPDLHAWIVARIPERLRHFDEGLATRGLRNVIAIRLFTFMMPWMHWLLGASRVSVRDATLGTALGVLPGVVALVLLGEVALGSWDGLRPWLLGAIAIFVVARAAQRLHRRLWGGTSS